MSYLHAHGAYFECTLEQERQVIGLIAAGACFYYQDYARPCMKPPEGSKILDVGTMSMEQAQQIIGGF